MDGNAVSTYTEGDMAIVTQKDGSRYMGVYTLAPGIDYYWRSIFPDDGYDQLVNPDVSAEIVGHVDSLDEVPALLNELGFCPTDGDAMPCMTCGAGL